MSGVTFLYLLLLLYIYAFALFYTDKEVFKEVQRHTHALGLF